MDNRLKAIILEISDKCEKLNYFEFDYYEEGWGVLWHPWFIEINNVNQSFTFTNLTHIDLQQLCEMRMIEVIKEFPADELKDEIVRKRYRLLI